MWWEKYSATRNRLLLQRADEVTRSQRSLDPVMTGSFEKPSRRLISKSLGKNAFRRVQPTIFKKIVCEKR